VWPVRRHRAEEGLDSVLIAGHRKVSLIIIQWNHPLLVLDHLIGLQEDLRTEEVADDVRWIYGIDSAGTA